MTKKSPDDTVDYGQPARRSRAPAAPTLPPESAGASTKPGVGVDRRRPPQRIDAGTRSVGRALNVSLIISDTFVRSSVARALVHAGCVVEIVSTPEQGAARVDVILADFDAPDVFSLVTAVRDAHPDAALIAWTTRPADVERGLRAMRYEPFSVVDRSARMPELIEAMRRVTGT